MGLFVKCLKVGCGVFAQSGAQKKRGKKQFGDCVCDPACVVNLCVFVHSIHLLVW